MSIRLERINSEIVKHLAIILREQEGKVMISVTKADTSRDLSHCRVLVSVYGTEDKKKYVDELNKGKASLRHQLAQKMSDIRTVPQLNFVLDESLDYGQKIDKILSNL